MTATDIDAESRALTPVIPGRQPSNGGPSDKPLRGGPEHNLRKRSWEIHAQVEIDHLRGLTARIKNGTSDGTPESIALSQVNDQLDVAELYLKRPARPWTWLRGTRLEGTWCHIHNADVALIELLDTGELKARCPEILTLAETYMKRGNPPKDDPALIAFKKWYGENSDPCIKDLDSCLRHHLATLLRQSYERVANEYYRLRRFQGAVIVTTLAVLVLVGALITVGTQAPHVVPMCFPDQAAEVVQTGDGAPACPTGAHSAPTSWDVATVALFGLLGAALVGVRLVVRRSVPSAVPMTATRWFQALLKVATGMLTAILGLLFLRAGVVPGFSQVDTQSQILVYAIVFGASQELITRFVDRRSNDLLAAVTSTDETAGDRTKSDDE